MFSEKDIKEREQKVKEWLGNKHEIIEELRRMELEMPRLEREGRQPKPNVDVKSVDSEVKTMLDWYSELETRMELMVQSLLKEVSSEELIAELSRAQSLETVESIHGHQEALEISRNRSCSKEECDVTYKDTIMTDVAGIYTGAFGCKAIEMAVKLRDEGSSWRKDKEAVMTTGLLEMLEQYMEVNETRANDNRILEEVEQKLG